MPLNFGYLIIIGSYFYFIGFRIKELKSVASSSYQIFDCFSKLRRSSGHVVSLLANSCSLVIHVMAHLDSIAANVNEWQPQKRMKFFTDLKIALQSWIRDKDVIGGSVFGRSISDTDTCRKELKVG